MTDEKLLQQARDAASYAAWLDIFARFTPEQRKTLANLFAHDWTISEIEMESATHGGKHRLIAEVPRAEALREARERSERQRAARRTIHAT